MCWWGVTNKIRTVGALCMVWDRPQHNYFAPKFTCYAPKFILPIVLFGIRFSLLYMLQYVHIILQYLPIMPAIIYYASCWYCRSHFSLIWSLSLLSRCLSWRLYMVLHGARLALTCMSIAKYLPTWNSYTCTHVAAHHKFRNVLLGLYGGSSSQYVHTEVGCVRQEVQVSQKHHMTIITNTAVVYIAMLYMHAFIKVPRLPVRVNHHT